MDAFSHVCRNPTKGLQALNSVPRSCALESDRAAIRRSSDSSVNPGNSETSNSNNILDEKSANSIYVEHNLNRNDGDYGRRPPSKDMNKFILMFLILEEIQTRIAEVYHGMFVLCAIRINAIILTTENKADMTSETFPGHTSGKIYMMMTSILMKKQVKKVSTVMGIRLWRDK